MYQNEYGRYFITYKMQKATRTNLFDCSVIVMKSLFYKSCLSCSTHTHPFNSPLFRTTRVSWYQKGKTNQEKVSGSGIS